MGGKSAGGGGFGGAGKGGGGGAPMSATAADQANATRRQNVYTTVGGLSRPGGGPGGPPNPRVRPSGPAGPPKGGAGGGAGAAASVPLPPSRPPGQGYASGIGPGVDVSPTDAASMPLESMAASPLSRLFQGPVGPALQGQAPFRGPSVQASPGGPPVAGADAEARMRRAKAVADFYGPRV